MKKIHPYTSIFCRRAGWRKYYSPYVLLLFVLLSTVSLARGFTPMPSRTSDTPGFVYTQSPADWRDVPIYQVMTDRFFDGDPANNDDNPYGDTNPAGERSIHGGDFEGLMEKLDYVQMLGMRAVWISPVVRNVNGEFHGFSATDFNEIDPHWGTLDDLRAFIDAAHARGIYVIIDVVQNHCGDRITSYDAGWNAFNLSGYTLQWIDSSRKHAPPFDDLSRFYNYGQIDNWNDPVQSLLGDFFSLDGINTELSAVRQDLITIYKAMIAATDCDGFRVDTAKHVEMDFWETFLPAIEAYADSIGKTNFIVFAEAWLGSDTDLAPFTATNRFNSALHFPLRNTMEDVFIWGQATDSLTTRLNNLALYDPIARHQLVQFLDNHDMPRYLSGGKLNGNAPLLEVALSFLYTSGRVPALYYGTEQAFNGGGDPYDREDMFDGQFEFGPSEGDDFDYVGPLFRHVRKLNLLRNAHPVLVKGDFTNRWETTNGRGLYVFSRRLADKEAVVALNTASQEQTAGNGVLGVQTEQTNGTVLVNLLDTGETVTVGEGTGSGKIAFAVPAYGAKIWVPIDDIVPLPPTIVAMTPSHDAADVARASNITIGFDQPMNTGSVEAGFDISPALSGTFTWDSPSQVNFIPANSMAANTRYTISFAADVQNADGYALGAGFEGLFTTGTNSVPLLKVPLRQYVLDGVVSGDETGALQVSTNGIDLYADFNGEELYFATQAAESGDDRFIFVTTSTGGTDGAPWAKSGQVDGLQHYIGNEVDNGWSGWFHESGGGGQTAATPGGWLEGVLDPVTAFGSIPAQLYIASVPYETPNGGDLISERMCPDGDSDGDLEAGEYFLLDLSAYDTDGDGLPDLQEDANANGQLDAGETHPLVTDTDADGMTDGEEHQAGTNPNDPASIFVSEIDYLQGSDSITVSWMGMSGHRYSVWQTDDLAATPPNWTLTDLQNAAGTGDMMHYSEPASNAPSAKIFRVQVWRE
jgi:glycosidase